MGDLLHQRSGFGESLIPASNRLALIEYAEGLISELPEQCASCPAAFACAVALHEDSGYGFPSTPRQVREMKFRHGESSYSMPSGQAQFALKGIVRDSNEQQNAGPTHDGKRCCLDPETEIDIDNPNREW